MSNHVCRTCGKLLPESAYQLRLSGRQAGYRMPSCRECRAAAHAAWKQKPGNAQRCRKVALAWYRDYQMVRAYGINEDRYQQILARQGGVCVVCGAPPTARRLAVDHDHRTGAVRGLLCSLCNRGLGSFRDTPEYLRAAASYLEAGRDLREADESAV